MVILKKKHSHLGIMKTEKTNVFRDLQVDEGGSIRCCPSCVINAGKVVGAHNTQLIIILQQLCFFQETYRSAKAKAYHALSSCRS